jgi:hypothetical protein
LLVAWYPLNGDILDYSGKGNVAVNSGAVVNNSGKTGSCYSFSGNYMTTVNPLIKGIDFTISLWARVNSSGNQCFCCTRTVTGDGISFFIISGKLRFDTNISTQWTTTYSFPIDTWVHVTITKDSNYKKLYINGVFHSSTNAVGDMTNMSSIFSMGASHINGSGWGNYLDGKMNDFRVYDSALSLKEIYELSRAKVLHYKFDELQEPTVNIANNVYLGFSGDRWQKVTSFPAGMPVDAQVFKRINANTYWGSFSSFIPTNPTPYNRTFTVSFWYYLEAGYDGTVDSLFFGAPNSGDSIYSSISTSLNNTFSTVIKGRWVYGEQTLKITTNAFSYDYFPGWSGGTIADGKHCYIAGFQLEEKDHATPYIGGSRDGVVKDCSGYGRNAVIALDTSPKWDKSSVLGSGSYYFKSPMNLNIYDGDVITCSSAVLPNDSFTFSFWTYRTADSCGYISIFRLGAYGVSGIDTRDGGVDIFSTTGVSLGFLSGMLASLNTWVFQTITFNRSNLSLKYYCNGVLTSSITLSQDLPISPTGLPLVLGYSYAGGVHRFFNGNLDDFRIYATELSVDDVLSLYKTRASLDSFGNNFAHQFVEAREHTIIDGEIKKFIFDSTYMSMGTVTLSGTDISDFEENDHTLGNAYIDGWVYCSDINYYMTTFEYCYENNTKGILTTVIPYTGTWVLGWNRVWFPCTGYVDAANTPWNTMTRLEFYRSGIATGVDTNQYIILKDFKVVKFKNNDSLKFGVSSKGIMRSRKVSEVGPVRGLVAWFPLINTSSDISGYGVSTTLNGAVIDSIGAKFNYTTDNILFNIDSGLSQNVISVSAWIKSDDITKNQNILSRNGPIFLRVTSSTFRFCIYANGTWCFANGNIPLQSNTWIHLVGVYNGSSMKGYVNGVLDIDVVKTGTLSMSTLGQYIIGYTTGGEDAPFGGYIKDMRIYNGELSDREINVLYKTGIGTLRQEMPDGTVYLGGRLKEV